MENRCASPLEMLPTELLLVIIEHFLDYQDVLNLSLVSTSINLVANKRIYEAFEYSDQSYTSERRLGTFLGALIRRPVISQYVRNVYIDEHAYLPWPFLERISHHRAAIAHVLRRDTALLLSYCSSVENIHLSVYENSLSSAQMDSGLVHPLSPLLRASGADDFPRLQHLSLEGVPYLELILRLLSRSSLRKATITTATLYGVPDSMTSDFPQCAVQELLVKIPWVGLLDTSVAVAFRQLLSCLTQLQILTMLLQDEDSGADAGRLVALTTILSTVAPTIEELNICIKKNVFKSWFSDLGHTVSPVPGLATFINVQTLRIPEWHIASMSWTGDVKPIVDRIARILPQSLKRLSFYTDVDTTVVIPDEVDIDTVVLPARIAYLHNHPEVKRALFTSGEEEHAIWKVLRCAVEKPNDVETKHVLEFYNTPVGQFVLGPYRDLAASLQTLRLDFKLRWKPVWAYAAALPHFKNLELVEFLHFTTEAGKCRSRVRPGRTPYRTGAERSVVIWKRHPEEW